MLLLHDRSLNLKQSPIKGTISPRLNRNITARQKALKAMLNRPLMQVGRSAKYPTSAGFLQVPFAGGNNSDFTTYLRYLCRNLVN